MISFPYDLDAHYAKIWVGDKAHLSETCEPGQLHLITNVETTAAPIDDGDVTNTSLPHWLKPSSSPVGTSWILAISMPTYSSRRKTNIKLIDSDRLVAIVVGRLKQPRALPPPTFSWIGKTSVSWTPAIDGHDNAVIKIKFAIARLLHLSNFIYMYPQSAPTTNRNHSSSTTV